MFKENLLSHNTPPQNLSVPLHPARRKVWQKCTFPTWSEWITNYIDKIYQLIISLILLIVSIEYIADIFIFSVLDGYFFVWNYWIPDMKTSYFWWIYWIHIVLCLQRDSLQLRTMNDRNCFLLFILFYLFLFTFIVSCS